MIFNVIISKGVNKTLGKKITHFLFNLAILHLKVLDRWPSFYVLFHKFKTRCKMVHSELIAKNLQWKWQIIKII